MDGDPYDDYYTPSELRSLRRAAGGVDAEIGAARVALIRLLSGPLAEEKPELVLRTVEAIVRSVRVKHQISRGAAENLLEAADTILAELGLGEGA